MFIGGILRGMRSMMPKFAFLVLEIGLRTPPNLRIFLKLEHFIRLGLLTLSNGVVSHSAGIALKMGH